MFILENLLQNYLFILEYYDWVNKCYVIIIIIIGSIKVGVVADHIKRCTFVILYNAGFNISGSDCSFSCILQRGHSDFPLLEQYNRSVAHYIARFNCLRPVRATSSVEIKKGTINI